MARTAGAGRRDPSLGDKFPGVEEAVVGDAGADD